MESSITSQTNDTTILSHHPYILCHFANCALRDMEWILTRIEILLAILFSTLQRTEHENSKRSQKMFFGMKTSACRKIESSKMNDTTIISHHPYILCHFVNYVYGTLVMLSSKANSPVAHGSTQ